MSPIYFFVALGLVLAATEANEFCMQQPGPGAESVSDAVPHFVLVNNTPTASNAGADVLRTRACDFDCVASNPGKCCSAAYPVCCPGVASSPDGFCCASGFSCATDGTRACYANGCTATGSVDCTVSYPGYLCCNTVNPVCCIPTAANPYGLCCPVGQTCSDSGHTACTSSVAPPSPSSAPVTSSGSTTSNTCYSQPTQSFVNLFSSGFQYCQQACSQWCWATVASQSIRYSNGQSSNCASDECTLASEYLDLMSNTGAAPAACCSLGCIGACNYPALMSTIQLLMRNYGVRSRWVTSSLSEAVVRSELSQSRPIILGYQGLSGGHVVLLFGYSELTGTYFISDPWNYGYGTSGLWERSWLQLQQAIGSTSVWSQTLYQITASDICQTGSSASSAGTVSSGSTNTATNTNGGSSGVYWSLANRIHVSVGAAAAVAVLLVLFIW